MLKALFAWLDKRYDAKWNYPCRAGGEHDWHFEDGSYLGCYGLPDRTVCYKCGDEA